MSRLSELIHFKELWEARKENAANAVKHYEEEITKEVQAMSIKAEEEQR